MLHLKSIYYLTLVAVIVYYLRKTKTTAEIHTMKPFDILLNPAIAPFIFAAFYILSTVTVAKLANILMAQPSPDLGEKGRIMYLGSIGAIAASLCTGLMIHQYGIYGIPILVGLGFMQISGTVYQVYVLKGRAFAESQQLADH